MKRLLFLVAFITILYPFQAQHYRVEHLGTEVNSTGSESCAVLLDDSVVLYSTIIQASAVNKSHHYLVDFSPVLSQLMQATRSADGTLSDVHPNRWGLNMKGKNCANVVHDPLHDVIYFSVQEMNNKSKPQIYWTRRTDGRWSKPRPMGGDVNVDGYSSTQPAVGYMPDGKTILYFCSDRPGGLGGLDIWYAVILSDGKPGRSTNLGAPVNTDSNEVTPFYSTAENILYFSSNRTGGQGGYDVYSSEGARNTWQLPRNLGKELNSPYNDLFFNLYPCSCKCLPVSSADDAASSETIVACGFLTSNRRGSLYEVDSNCCNDLYQWSRIYKPVTTPPVRPQPRNETLLDFLPLSLYFHNDEPDPATTDTVTRLSYTACWRHYTQMRDEYKGAQSSPADKRKWDSVQWAVDFFFDHEVTGNYNRLLSFLTLLNDELRSGKHITLTLDGYASPLHESQYNVNLSKRRISSIRNLMKEWNDEALLPYLNNGSLRIEEAAHGAPDTDAVAPSDPLRNPKSAKSVYSIEAALDRRVDIISVSSH